MSNLVVKVFNTSGKPSGELIKPAVFSAPIRPDIIRFAHTQLNKNARQPYAVSRYAGIQCTAHSWGTGRAVARNPRKSGGVGAYANFCRGGHMFAPTTVIRRWHRKCNSNIRRYAVASAIAASAVTSLVEARGHRISDVQSLPLVVDLGDVSKTKEAHAILTSVGALKDLERVKNSRNIRAGVGKMRNRRYTQSKGPLLVYNTEEVSKAFRNIPGVDLCHVSRLNLLQLAPGSHLGRFVIWTKSAFAALDDVYASKKGYTLPTSVIRHTDVQTLVNSESVRKVFRHRLPPVKHEKKLNALDNLVHRQRLNPAIELPIQKKH